MAKGKPSLDCLIHQLSSESDLRSELNADRFTNYNTTLMNNKITPLGTCTASSLHSDDMACLIKALEGLNDNDLFSIDTVSRLWKDIRYDFYNLLGLDERKHNVVFVPSGTDSETLISSVILEKDGSEKLHNVVVAPLEVGSGTELACGGRAFSERSPDGSSWEIGDSIIPSVSNKTSVHGVEVRSSSGNIPPMSQMEDDIEEIINNSISHDLSVSVHIVAGSKTGVHAPSIEFIQNIEELNYPKLHVLVDAAQGRFSRTGVRKSLEAGRIVTITGSKFFGAPPFCGAVIFPKTKYPEIRWREEYEPLFNQMCFEHHIPNQSYTVRNGVLLRWIIGISNMKTYYSTDPKMRLKVLKWFEEDGVKAINENRSLRYIEPQFFSPDEKNRLLATNKTIHTFQVSSNGRNLGLKELKIIHSRLIDKNNMSGKSIGQPVLLSRLTEESGLRIALGSKLIVDTISSISSGLNEASAREGLFALLSETCSEISRIAEDFDEN